MSEDSERQVGRGPAARGSELDADPFGGGGGRARRRSGLVWLVGLVAFGVALRFLLMLDTGEAPQRTPLLSAHAPSFEIDMPNAGRDRLLSVAQIRWCLREDVRIEVFEPRLAHAEPQRFNVMVSDFNRRCTRFRYRGEDLEQARRDIDDARKWIVEEALAAAYAPASSASSDGLAAAGYSILTKDVQVLLLATGRDPGPIDGRYGARTKTAVESFEKDLGRPPTGAISEALRRELLERVRSAGIAETHLLEATAAESAAIRESCEHAAGVTAYNRCVESKLTSLAEVRAPRAHEVTEPERSAIEEVCLRARLRGGEAGYDRCVEEQLADLARLDSEPTVAAMTEAERAAVERRCSSTGTFYGPAAFYRCAQERLAEIAETGGGALL